MSIISAIRDFLLSNRIPSQDVVVFPGWTEGIKITTNWYLWKHKAGERDPLNLMKGYTSYTHIPGNLLLYEGAEIIGELIGGIGAETPYDNSNARIGVGNGTAVAVATQTNLQGGLTLYKGMEVGFPAIEGVNNEKLAFQSVFLDTEAEFAWEEFAVDNGAAANKLLNRKVQAQGTKTAGNEWTVKVVFTFS